ncbi:MAG: ScaI family restriction endonuclease [Lachnospiraceae bacterium]|nr:ScaI family restriction endonuclease [Lachnospiraceae bacterium]
MIKLCQESDLMCMISPYKNIEVENWRAVTESLVRQHPLSPYMLIFV